MSAQLPEPGAKLDGYTILRELGRGGMGAVFLAEKGAARFAIKVLLALGPEQLLRFEREARAMAAVDRHPNIVTIHTLGRYQGLPYVVMDYVEGGDLRALLKARGALESEEALELMTAVAEALGYVHERGIVHRDLKPENILIREDGRPVVTDFGLAQGRGLEVLTRSGTIVGTPHYMAPEQLEAGFEVAASTDVWALGVILIEALSGQRPFRGANVLELGRSILRSEPALPAAPPAITEVARRALSKDPRARFADAGAFKESLEEARRSLAPWPPWLRRTVVAAVLGAALALVAPFLPSDLLRPSPRAHPSVQRALTALEGFDAAFLDAAEELLAARLRSRDGLAASLARPPPKGGRERLRAIYEELALSRDEGLSLGILTEEERQRVKIAYALFKRSSPAVVRRLESGEPFGRLVPVVLALREDPERPVPAGLTALGNSSDPAEARLLRLVALLAHHRAGRWREACQEARRLRDEHGEPGLEAAVLEACTRPEEAPSKGLAFWSEIFERALGCGAEAAARRAFLALATLDPRGSGGRLSAALDAAQSRDRPALAGRLFRDLQVALSRARGREQKALEESLLVLPEALGRGLSGEQARVCARALGAYVLRPDLKAEERLDVFCRALELNRLFPEAPVPYPLPSLQVLITTQDKDFLSFRRAAFEATQKQESEVFAQPGLIYDFLRATSRKGIYVETNPSFLYRLKKKLGLKATEGSPADRFVLAHIDLRRSNLDIPLAEQRPLFEELKAGLASIIEAWMGKEEFARSLALARYRRGRLLQFGARKGWLPKEAGMKAARSDLALAAADPKHPRGAEALVCLWLHHRGALGAGDLRLFREHTDALFASLRAAEGLRPRDRGPWPSAHPRFTMTKVSLGLLQGHTELALSIDRADLARAFLDDCGPRIGRPILVRFCRGLIRVHAGEYQRALSEVEEIPTKKHEFIIELRAQAYAKLGQRDKALEAIEKHHSEGARRRLTGLVDSRWRPEGTLPKSPPEQKAPERN